MIWMMHIFLSPIAFAIEKNMSKERIRKKHVYPIWYVFLQKGSRSVVFIFACPYVGHYWSHRESSRLLKRVTFLRPIPRVLICSMGKQEIRNVLPIVVEQFFPVKPEAQVHLKSVLPCGVHVPPWLHVSGWQGLVPCSEVAKK